MFIEQPLATPVLLIIVDKLEWRGIIRMLHIKVWKIIFISLLWAYTNSCCMIFFALLCCMLILNFCPNLRNVLISMDFTLRCPACGYMDKIKRKTVFESFIKYLKAIVHLHIFLCTRKKIFIFSFFLHKELGAIYWWMPVVNYK